MLNPRKTLTIRRLKDRKRQASLLAQVNVLPHKVGKITYIQGKQQPGLISR
jgi:uncharacterized membrane protein YhaH (DUF805 family)